MSPGDALLLIEAASAATKFLQDIRSTLGQAAAEGRDVTDAEVDALLARSGKINALWEARKNRPK